MPSREECFRIRSGRASDSRADEKNKMIRQKYFSRQERKKNGKSSKTDSERLAKTFI